MLKYIGFRLFQALLGLWFIATLVFILSRSIGDPAEVFTARNSGVDAREIMAAKLGLDKPLYQQYARYIGQLVRLDLGDSVKQRHSGDQILTERLPATFSLGLIALIFALVFSIPLGVLGAVYRDSPIDWLAKGPGVSGSVHAAVLAWHHVDYSVRRCLGVAASGRQGWLAILRAARLYLGLGRDGWHGAFGPFQHDGCAG